MPEAAHAPRLFSCDRDIARVGEGLLGRSLPRADWTHEAHLAATCWLLATSRLENVERDLPQVIREYNLAVGGVNDDGQGYHETLTQLYIAGVRAHVGAQPPDQSLLVTVNLLLSSARGVRTWPLTFYTSERLFSVPARRTFVEPDLLAFSEAPAEITCHPRVSLSRFEDVETNPQPR